MTCRVTSTQADELAREASSYLDVVETFAALDADPHAAARTRAARERQIEQRSPQTARKGGRRWTR